MICEDILDLKEFTIENIFPQKSIRIVSISSKYLLNKNITKFKNKIYYKQFETKKERDLYFENNFETIFKIKNDKYLITKNFYYLKNKSEDNNFVYNLEISGFYYNNKILECYKKLNKCIFFNLID